MSTRSQRRTVAALAAAVVALFAGSVAAVVDVRRPPEIRGVSGPLEEEITRIVRWVEDARGLRFIDDVRVEVLPQDELLALLREEDEGSGPVEDPEGAAATAQSEADVLLALGVVDRRFDPRAAGDAYTSAVAGAYDNESDVLYLPEVPLTPFRRQVIAHELVHALDDQHFGLDRTPQRLVDETSLAFLALAEGDARDIEVRYVASLPQAERDAAKAEEEGGGGDKVAADLNALPEGLLAIFSFPYAGGAGFVKALRDSGGNARVDRAFRDPPTSSEHILHPDRYLAGERVAVTTRPKPGTPEVLARDVLGEMGLLILLLNHGGEAAMDAADGWGGDRYVAWKDGTRTCVKAVVRMDTPAATTRLQANLGPWNKAHPGSSVTRQGEGTTDDELVLESCVAPG